MIKAWIVAHGLTHTLTAETIYEDLQYTIDTIREQKIVEAEIKRFNEVCENVAKERNE